MNIFFTHRQKYTVNDSIENVQANIENITNRQWYDFSNNITGRLNGDGSFKLKHKWSFAVIGWMENSPAYLSGTLTVDNNNTIIDTTLRPNSAFVMFFYLLTILFVCDLLEIDTFIQGPKTFKLIFYPFFNLILFGVMKMFTTGLRNRFEKLLQLQSDV